MSYSSPGVIGHGSYPIRRTPVHTPVTRRTKTNMTNGQYTPIAHAHSTTTMTSAVVHNPTTATTNSTLHPPPHSSSNGPTMTASTTTASAAAAIGAPLVHRHSLVRLMPRSPSLGASREGSPAPATDGADAMSAYFTLQADNEALEWKMERRRRSLINSRHTATTTMTPMATYANEPSSESNSSHDHTPQGHSQPVQPYYDEYPTSSLDGLDEEKGDSEARRSRSSHNSSNYNAVPSNATKLSSPPSPTAATATVTHAHTHTPSSSRTRRSTASSLSATLSTPLRIATGPLPYSSTGTGTNTALTHSPSSSARLRHATRSASTNMVLHSRTIMIDPTTNTYGVELYPSAPASPHAVDEAKSDRESSDRTVKPASSATSSSSSSYTSESVAVPRSVRPVRASPNTLALETMHAALYHHHHPQHAHAHANGRYSSSPSPSPSPTNTTATSTQSSRRASPDPTSGRASQLNGSGAIGGFFNQSNASQLTSVASSSSSSSSQNLNSPARTSSPNSPTKVRATSMSSHTPLSNGNISQHRLVVNSNSHHSGSLSMPSTPQRSTRSGLSLNTTTTTTLTPTNSNSHSQSQSIRAMIQPISMPSSPRASPRHASGTSASASASTSTSGANGYDKYSQAFLAVQTAVGTSVALDAQAGTTPIASLRAIGGGGGGGGGGMYTPITPVSVMPSSSPMSPVARQGSNNYPSATPSSLSFSSSSSSSGVSSSSMLTRRRALVWADEKELVRQEQCCVPRTKFHNRNGLRSILRHAPSPSASPPPSQSPVSSTATSFNSPSQRWPTSLASNQSRHHQTPLVHAAGKNAILTPQQRLARHQALLELESEAIYSVQLGASLIKYNSSGKPQKRWFFVVEDDDEWTLRWENVKKDVHDNTTGFEFALAASQSGTTSPTSGSSTPIHAKKSSGSSSSSSSALPFFQIGPWKFNQERSRSLIDATGLHYGPFYSANFCRFLDKLTTAQGDLSKVGKPWLCFSVQFKDRTIDLLCHDEAQVTEWFLALQALAPLSVYHLTRSMILWQRLIMKLNFHGLPYLRQLMLSAHPDHHLHHASKTPNSPPSQSLAASAAARLTRMASHHFVNQFGGGSGTGSGNTKHQTHQHAPLSKKVDAH